MPMLIQTIEDYLYKNKRDVFVLQLKNQSEKIFFDKENQENQQIEKEQLDWLMEHNVEFKKTVPQCLIMGWNGQYFVDFKGWEDPNLVDYTNQFENSDGSSNYPTKYQMGVICYNEWVSSGELKKYEQYLIDREDPNYEW